MNNSSGPGSNSGSEVLLLEQIYFNKSSGSGSDLARFGSGSGSGSGSSSDSKSEVSLFDSGLVQIWFRFGSGLVRVRLSLGFRNY